MIEARGLSRAFGERTAVENVTFTLEAGKICALLGPNGAGKTTTIRMLLGLIRPTAGEAVVANVAIPGAARNLAELRARVGFLTETPGFYDRLSAMENLTLFGRLYRVEAVKLGQQIEHYLKHLGLWERRDEAVATFSKGMKQRLAIVRTVFHDPEVLFFDEPTAGLDPESARGVRQLILSLKHAGRTIVVCTHNLTEATELADVIGVMQRRLLVFGSLASLTNQPGGTRFRVVVADRALDAARLAATIEGVQATVVSPTDVDLIVPNPDATVPMVIRRLVEGGIGIREVRRVVIALEEIYLDAIGQSS